MQRLAFMFFAVAVVMSTAFIIATGMHLPDQVAAHFSARGTANRFVSREHYVVIFSLLASALPMALAAITALVVRQLPRLVRVCNRGFWMQPENRATAIAYITARGFTMGGVLALLFAVIHYVIIRANAEQPPHLASGAFSFFTAGVVIAFAAVSAAFSLQMRRVARAGRRVDA